MAKKFLPNEGQRVGGVSGGGGGNITTRRPLPTQAPKPGGWVGKMFPKLGGGAATPPTPGTPTTTVAQGSMRVAPARPTTPSPTPGLPPAEKIRPRAPQAPGGGATMAPPGSILTETFGPIGGGTSAQPGGSGASLMRPGEPGGEGFTNHRYNPGGPDAFGQPAPTAPAQPPVGAPAPAPPVSGPGIQGFDAEDNLIGTQINPQDNARLQGVQGQLDQALQGLEGPDRGQIARDLFTGIREDTADDRTRGIRQISEAAGRLGRIGSGGVSTDLGSLEERLQRDETRKLRDLSAGAAGESLQDQLKKLGGTADIEQLLSGIGAGKRGEVRGERDYQRDLSQDPIRQRLLEEQLQSGAFDRYLRQGQVLGGLSGGS